MNATGLGDCAATRGGGRGCARFCRLLVLGALVYGIVGLAGAQASAGVEASATPGISMRQAAAQAPAATATDGVSELPSPQIAATTTGEQAQQAPANPPGTAAASINGTVLDESGAAVAGARVALNREGQSAAQNTLTGDHGEFSFVNLTPGAFTITITARGFAPQTLSGSVAAGENFAAPAVTLRVASASSEVEVVVPRKDIAEAEIKQQEKQRVLGVLPNFWVTYVHDAEPLSPRQKFELAWKSIIDPFTFVETGAVAGIEQAENDFPGYGSGGLGYAKRFGANYANTVSGTYLGGAILPTLLKQDPRYFYKGHGSAGSRILYALANVVICKGDNKQWQPNYSGLGGLVASGAISNLYYPRANRGVGLTFENAGIGAGEYAVSNLLEEFLFRKLTPKIPKQDSNTP